MRGICNWNQDGEGEQGWDAGCGNRFMLNEDTPSANGMKFCCYCGKKLTESPYEDDQPDTTSRREGET